MSSLQPRLGHGLLRCRLCKFELTAAVGVLVCRNHHGFDLAREGYVNLLRGNRRRPPTAGGDSPEQLPHRAAFLDAGHFDAITGTIAEHLGQNDDKLTFGRWHILDAGFGTGYHLARLASALRPPAIGSRPRHRQGCSTSGGPAVVNARFCRRRCVERMAGT